MLCLERNRLLEKCAVAVHAFTKISIKWQELAVDQAGGDQYCDRRATRVDARVVMDHAYAELERHDHLHHCQPYS